jgi:type II secretory pathway component PulM
MTFFENLETRISQLDKKSWYTYLAITGAVLFAIIGAILFYYFTSTAKWEQKIADINETRTEVKRLLSRAERVQKERSEVMALLEEDPNFNIKAYIQEVLERIGIAGNMSAENVVVTSSDENHQVDVATYQLSGITMKQLTEFLNELENNKRTFTKELDISKSKKVPRTIDVGITIATIMPKGA